MALNSLYSVDVALSKYSLTHYDPLGFKYKSPISISHILEEVLVG